MRLSLDPACQPRHQDVVVDPIKELLQVHIDHPAVASGDMLASPFEGIVSTTSQPKAEAVVGERGVVPALQGLIQGLLNQSIDNRRNAQRPQTTARLGYFYLPHWRRFVGSVEQFHPDGFPAGLQQGFQFVDGDAVNAWSALIADHPLVSPPHVLTT